MGKLTLLLLVLLGWLQYSLWFGKNGIHDYVWVKDEVVRRNSADITLRARNNQLFAEIKDLKKGQEAIEERARNELGMIKPGESFYRLVPDTSKHNAQQSLKENSKQ
ncbi:cell division protein [Xenorhabdus bovienii str. Jollieti]|uniref:Cell division protein FtsB n=1 Tax=Xenorhabdus bovienii (strain SS-2004) TaxID=406818 RepID=D3V4Z3_XENBS|nr:cell division protein FtsB [Xenorhabdus bovienii]CBJ82722.1 cell division protein [Xenorhabdus bovienii SS-2004]CDH28505.1 cell division protein [Xenorhabdus bovienii str. Jollieti]